LESKVGILNFLGTGEVVGGAGRSPLQLLIIFVQKVSN